MLNKFWEKHNNSYNRKTGKRGFPKQRILIVCEGEKTEPNYFKEFRVSSAVVEISGTGTNTFSLVQQAIQIQKTAKKNKEPFDQVWCVFDRDNFPPENFNKALDFANKNNLKTAYSNEAFELWYLLHFCYIDSAIHRKDYISKLEKQLNVKYQKNSSEMYDILSSRQDVAIKNASKLLSKYLHPKPEKDNPSTTVHLLVKELTKYI